MSRLDKGTSRFGSDWDLDLGWILFWVVLLSAIVSIIGFLSWASVQNNRDNVTRDAFYAKNCKIVLQTDNTKAFECQNK